MESRFRLLGHPAHPILVMFPTALLPLLVFLDALHWWFGDVAFWTVGFWVAVAGAVMSLIAIVPGAVDMAGIPDGTKAHRTALFHAIVGTTILLVFVASVVARWPAGAAPGDAFASFGVVLGIDIIGTLLVTLQGWLGGELVYRHHVGVKTVPEGGDPVVLEGGSADGKRATRERQRRPGL